MGVIYLYTHSKFFKLTDLDLQGVVHQEDYHTELVLWFIDIKNVNCLNQEVARKIDHGLRWSQQFSF